MKPLFIIAVMAGLVTLCGVGNLPCFADSGAGVSIELTTTVTGGSSWYNWFSGYGGYFADNQPRQPAPYVPPVTNSLPPKPPTYPTVNNPTPYVPVVGQPLPQEASNLNWSLVFSLGVASLGVILFLWYILNKRRAKALLKQQQSASNQPQ